MAKQNKFQTKDFCEKIVHFCKNFAETKEALIIELATASIVEESALGPKSFFGGIDIKLGSLKPLPILSKQLSNIESAELTVAITLEAVGIKRMLDIRTQLSDGIINELDESLEKTKRVLSKLKEKGYNFPFEEASGLIGNAGKAWESLKNHAANFTAELEVASKEDKTAGFLKDKSKIMGELFEELNGIKKDLGKLCKDNKIINYGTIEKLFGHGTFVDKFGNNFSPLELQANFTIEALNSGSFEKYHESVNKLSHTCKTAFTRESDKAKFEGETVAQAMKRTYKELEKNINSLKEKHDLELPYEKLHGMLKDMANNYNRLKSLVSEFNKSQSKEMA